MVIPVYNGARFIRKSVQSALDQTYEPKEIVVVDDGSTDETGAILSREFTGRIRLVSQKNRGLSGARNAGIAAGTGEYIALLDADDWWHPRKLEVQVASLKSNAKAGVTYTGVTVVEESTGEEVAGPPRSPESLWPVLRWCNPGLPPSSVMLRRSVLDEVGGFNENLRAAEDWEMWFKVRRASEFTSTPEPYTFYLVSAGSMCRDANLMFRYGEILANGLLIEDLHGLDRALWRRRILSYQAFSAAMTARDAGDKALEQRYLWRCLSAWPSPFFQPYRFKAMAVTFVRSFQK